MDDNSLTKINNYALTVGNFDTLDDRSLAKISENMPEIHRAVKSTGKSQSQTTIQLMTLNMMAETPIRRLRQIAAEISKKESALHEAYFNAKKSEIKIRDWYADGSEISVIKAQEAQNLLMTSKSHIENAYKDIGTLQQAYIDIQETYGIGEWDEADLEAEETVHHMRLAFKQSYRDVLNTGGIGAGNQEYLEQFGIHPQSALSLIKNYIISCDEMIKEGKLPTSSSLYAFIDAAADAFKDAPKEAMKRIGIKSITRDEFLYLEKPNEDL